MTRRACLARAAALVTLTAGYGGAFGLAPACAGDVTYAVFLDGRPLDRHHDSALAHGGIVYIDVVRAVKAFDGLLTVHGTELDVTLGGRLLTCTLGELSAVLDGDPVQLPGAPFETAGTTYVPLATVAELARADVTLDPRGKRVRLHLQ